MSVSYDIISISIDEDCIYLGTDSDGVCTISLRKGNAESNFDITRYYTNNFDDNYTCKFYTELLNYSLLLIENEVFLIYKKIVTQYVKYDIKFPIKTIIPAKIDDDSYYIIVGWAGDIMFLNDKFFYQIKTHIIIQNIEIIFFYSKYMLLIQGCNRILYVIPDIKSLLNTKVEYVYFLYFLGKI